MKITAQFLGSLHMYHEYTSSLILYPFSQNLKQRNTFFNALLQR